MSLITRKFAHRLAITSLASLIFAACSGPNRICTEGATSVQSPLINAVDAGPTEYASIIKASYGGRGCTTSRVGDKLLLLAAHCFTTLTPGEDIVLSRGNSEPKWTQTFQTKNISRHPSYTGNKSTALNEFDVAVIELTATMGVEVAMAAVDTTPSFVGETLTMIGYGCNAYGEDGGTGSNMRRFGDSVVSQLYPGMIRTAGPTYACPGDSGGPAIRLNNLQKIVGVASSADFEADGGPTRSNYARLELIDSWLRNLGVSMSSPPPPPPEAGSDGSTDASKDAMSDAPMDATPSPPSLDATVVTEVDAGKPRCVDGALVP